MYKASFKENYWPSKPKELTRLEKLKEEQEIQEMECVEKAEKLAAFRARSYCVSATASACTMSALRAYEL